MTGCVSIRDDELNLLVARLTAEKSYTDEDRNDLAQLIQILKDLNYPKVELVDIISIAMMLDYILSDSALRERCHDFIASSFDVIDYILSHRTYLKIEDRIISLEYDFYTNICTNPLDFERKFINELKKLLTFSNNQ